MAIDPNAILATAVTVIVTSGTQGVLRVLGRLVSRCKAWIDNRRK